MRTVFALLVVGVTLALAIDADSKKALDESLSHSAKARHEVLLKLEQSFKTHLPHAAKHAMKALQSGTSGSTCDQQKFQSKAINLVAQCPAIQQATVAFQGNATSAEMSAICGNGCPATFREFVAGNLNCFGRASDGKLVLGQVDTLIVACRTSTDAAGNEVYCGQEIGNFFKVVACESIPVQSACESPSFSCSWNSQNSKCELKATQAVIEGICTTCIRELISMLVVIRPTAESRLMQLTYSELVCKKSGTEYCLPKMNTFETTNGELSFTATKSVQNTWFEALCADYALWSCYRGVANFGTRLMVETTKYAYDRCIQTYASSSTSFRASRCYPMLDAALRNAKRSENLMKIFCHRVKASDYCLTYATDFGTAVGTCAASPTSATEACCTASDFAFTGAGCCLKSLMTVTFGGDTTYPAGEVPASRVAIPNPPGLTGPPDYSNLPDDFFSPAPSNSYATTATVLKNLLSSCSKAVAADVTKHIADGCVVARTTANPQMTLKLKINYNKIKNDAKLIERIRNALRSDVASNLNVAPSQIKNDTLVGDNSVTVTVSRRMSAQQEAISATAGCKYSFGVEAATDAEATAVAENYQTSVSENTFSVAATGTVVAQECSGCTDSASLVDGASGSSGATAVSVFAAAVAAAFAIMM